MDRHCTDFNNDAGLSHGDQVPDQIPAAFAHRKPLI
jgi:hypothetical protein